MTIISGTYPPRKAAELSGLKSVAMLDYLQRVGVFNPQAKKGNRGRGRERRYTFRDVLTLKAIGRLLASGASVSALKIALTEFQRHDWSADPATLEDAHGGIRYFVASADKIYLAKDAKFLIGLSEKGQLAFSFIIDLDLLHSELCEGIGLPKLQQELEL